MIVNDYAVVFLIRQAPLGLLTQIQGESNLHQIAVTILCRTGKPPLPPQVLLFLQDLLYESTVFPTGKLGAAKSDAKWWPSIRCMFDSL